MTFNKAFYCLKSGNLICSLTIGPNKSESDLFISGRFGRYEIHLLPKATQIEITDWIVSMALDYAGYLKDMEEGIDLHQH